mmetsp:Transcript_48524/g.105550  ORF Transcript_48524/g.105550 Transcript_48524/m.105550 type:complete len:226 (-) Transcript_48524:50-727(-)
MAFLLTLSCASWARCISCSTEIRLSTSLNSSDAASTSRSARAAVSACFRRSSSISRRTAAVRSQANAVALRSDCNDACSRAASALTAAVSHEAGPGFVSGGPAAALNCARRSSRVACILCRSSSHLCRSSSRLGLLPKASWPAAALGSWDPSRRHTSSSLRRRFTSSLSLATRACSSDPSRSRASRSAAEVAAMSLPSASTRALSELLLEISSSCCLAISRKISI